MSAIVYLSLGSNQGESVAILKKAYSIIAENVGEILAKSSFYETEPWGFETDSNFVNSVISVETDLFPEQLLESLLKIESKLGRIRSESKGYASRVIDLDILAYENVIILTEKLALPHPRMHLRAFVLIPLQEINSNWVHPSMNKGIGELLKGLNNALFVKRIDPD